MSGSPVSRAEAQVSGQVSRAEAPRRGRPPLTDARRREQRLEISRHAVRLFRTQGVAATSGEQIARAAGVSERTLWRWFRSKEACVEPLLSVSLESFQATLRTWPAGADLLRHLSAEYRFLPGALPADVDAVLAVVRMTREEIGLRAVWLVLHERAEPTLAGVLAMRLDTDADDARMRAAIVNTVLRVATDDLADAAADGLTTEAVERFHAQVSGALLRAFDADTHS